MNVIKTNLTLSQDRIGEIDARRRLIRESLEHEPRHSERHARLTEHLHNLQSERNMLATLVTNLMADAAYDAQFGHGIGTGIEDSLAAEERRTHR